MYWRVEKCVCTHSSIILVFVSVVASELGKCIPKWHSRWVHIECSTPGHAFPESKVHGVNMGPIWGRQDPGGPHVDPMNLAIRVLTTHCCNNPLPCYRRCYRRGILHYWCQWKMNVWSISTCKIWMRWKNPFGRAVSLITWWWRFKSQSLTDTQGVKQISLSY